jgi:multidrug resistance efflux pump
MLVGACFRERQGLQQALSRSEREAAGLRASLEQAEAKGSSLQQAVAQVEARGRDAVRSKENELDRCAGGVEVLWRGEDHTSLHKSENGLVPWWSGDVICSHMCCP